MKKHSEAPKAAQVSKKPYRRPVLHVYGNIRAITQAVGSTGLMDGGAVAGMMMTSP